MNPSRQYKLLRDLPDCNSGTILTQEKPDGLYMYRGKTDGEDDASWYVKEVVENNPDWFQLIEQREWEIVKYKRQSYGCFDFYTKGDDGVFYTQNKKNYFHEKDVSSLTVEIHSVKRLSDGEVFTVGDEVQFRSHGAMDWDEQYFGKIISITPCISGKPELEFEIYETEEMESAVHKWIRNIRKKQPQQETQDSFVFKWTDDVVYEALQQLYWDLRNKELLSLPLPGYVDSFKKSKQQSHIPKEPKIGVQFFDEEGKRSGVAMQSDKQERIEVRVLPGSHANNMGKSYFAVEVGCVFGEEKLPSIKQAIEQVLNDGIVSPNDYMNSGKIHFKTPDRFFDSPMFTPAQLEEAERRAFGAGKSGKFRDVNSDLYPTFEDYLKSKQP